MTPDEAVPPRAPPLSRARLPMVDRSIVAPRFGARARAASERAPERAVFVSASPARAAAAARDAVPVLRRRRLPLREGREHESLRYDVRRDVRGRRPRRRRRARGRRAPPRGDALLRQAERSHAARATRATAVQGAARGALPRERPRRRRAPQRGGVQGADARDVRERQRRRRVRAREGAAGGAGGREAPDGGASEVRAGGEEEAGRGGGVRKRRGERGERGDRETSAEAGRRGVRERIFSRPCRVSTRTGGRARDAAGGRRARGRERTTRLGRMNNSAIEVGSTSPTRLVARRAAPVRRPALLSRAFFRAR
eukprot:30147-Pelagococcus_subviridis.AAC.3